MLLQTIGILKIYVKSIIGIAKASLQVAELTKNDHPDRDGEKAWIIASGGFIYFSAMPRVNGILADSRAIGDVYLKR